MEIMDFLHSNKEITSTIMVTAIIGLSELFKPHVNSKYIPLVSLVLGIIGCIFLTNPETDIVVRAFNGIIVGLGACGLYSAQKNLRE